MKRYFPLLLTLMLLTACGVPAAEEPEVSTEEPPEETASLPDLTPPGALSAPAIVTEGRPPTADYELPPSLAAAQKDPQYDIHGWASGGTVGLLAEALEADAAFYATPYQANGNHSVLLCWGSSLAEFDWEFLTPRTVLPQMDCFDVDGDGEDELVVICYIGSGTGVSVEELHIVEKNHNGTLTAYTLPQSLWLEQVPALFDAAAVDGRTFAILGRELVEIDGEGLDPETACTGWIAGFNFNGDFMTFQGAFALCHKGSAVPCYVADTSADVFYKDGVFTLRNFHLYSYDQ